MSVLYRLGNGWRNVDEIWYGDRSRSCGEFRVYFKSIRSVQPEILTFLQHFSSKRLDGLDGGLDGGFGSGLGGGLWRWVLVVGSELGSLVGSVTGIAVHLVG